MRFREGMRRVALALGVFGLLGCGGIAGISPGEEISSNLHRQREFASVQRIPLVREILANASKRGIKDATLHIASAEIGLIELRNGEVFSLEKNGTTIYEPDAKSPWAYLSLVLLPLGVLHSMERYAWVHMDRLGIS